VPTWLRSDGVFGLIKRELRRRSAIEAVIGHMKTGGHLGRCYARVRRSVSVRIFPISVFGPLPKETRLFSTETGSRMAFLTAQVRGDRCKTLTKGTRPASALFVLVRLQSSFPMHWKSLRRFGGAHALNLP
jgi:hypothetical protein